MTSSAARASYGSYTGSNFILQKYFPSKNFNVEKKMQLDVANEPLVTAIMHYSFAALRKKVEPKRLHPWSRFMVCNSAPPLALFWCHLQRWSCFCLKKRLHPPRWQRFPKRLQGGAVLAPLFSQCEINFS